MNKKQKPRDRHLDVPAEANRDKHVNFLAEERSENDPSTDHSKGYLNEDPDKNVERKKIKFKEKDSNSER